MFEMDFKEAVNLISAFLLILCGMMGALMIILVLSGYIAQAATGEWIPKVPAAYMLSILGVCSVGSLIGLYGVVKTKS